VPTGYTAAVADGEITDLRTFALTCARGMGALVTMRDEPFDAPIPDRLEPSTGYYDEALAKARADLARLNQMTDAECAAAQAEERVAEERAQTEYAARKADQRARYEAMLAQVEAWTTEAEGIRDFMLEQLRQSIDFDCSTYEREPAPILTPGEWRHERLKKLAKDIGHHEEQRAAEVARTENRNRWLNALRASLPPPPAPANAEAA
jgi:hypothetical protein